MKLYYAPTSPFARKVRIAAREAGVGGRIDLVETNPWTDVALRAVNPLAKVPTLVADDGLVLFESPVICEYLDSLAETPVLFPAAGRERWEALLTQGLCDGAATAAGRLFADGRKPEEKRDPGMAARFNTAIDAALDRLEATPLSSQRWTIAEVAAAALIGYLFFRWPQRGWLSGRPALADWYTCAAERPSMRETRHRLPED